MAFSQESNLTQDESKAIRGLGGVGSSAPFGPDRGGMWRAGDEGYKRLGRKRKKNHPRGNLPHCGNKLDIIKNLHRFLNHLIQLEIIFYHANRLAPSLIEQGKNKTSSFTLCRGHRARFPRVYTSDECGVQLYVCPLDFTNNMSNDEQSW